MHQSVPPTITDLDQLNAETEENRRISEMITICGSEIRKHLRIPDDWVQVTLPWMTAQAYIDIEQVVGDDQVYVLCGTQLDDICRVVICVSPRGITAVRRKLTVEGIGEYDA